MGKEKSSVEVKAEKWMKENGFQFLVLKQYISKTIYEIEKDGFKTKFELPMSVADVKKYMELYKKDFEMQIKLKEFRSKTFS